MSDAFEDDVEEIYEAEFDVFDFIELVDRLTDLLEEETALLDEGRASEIEALLDQKKRLSEAVRQCALAVERDPSIIDDGTEEAEGDLAELRAAVAALHDAASVNERALRAAVRSTDRLVRAVVSATAEAQAGSDGRYTPMGLSPSPKAQPTTKRRSVDEVL